MWSLSWDMSSYRERGRTRHTRRRALRELTCDSAALTAVWEDGHKGGGLLGRGRSSHLLGKHAPVQQARCPGRAGRRRFDASNCGLGDPVGASLLTATGDTHAPNRAERLNRELI